MHAPRALVSLALVAMTACGTSADPSAEVAVAFDSDSDVSAMRIDADLVSCDDGRLLERQVRTFDRTTLLGAADFEAGDRVSTRMDLDLAPGCYDLVARPAADLGGERWQPSAQCAAVRAHGVQVTPHDVARVELASACEATGDEWTFDPYRTVPGCTLTQGYWKNHPEAWPVDWIEIGGDIYDEEEMLAILNMPVKGDASIQIAHQVIAAWLNIKSGTTSLAIDDLIADSNWWFDAHNDGDGLPYGVKTDEFTSYLTDGLTAFNEGEIYPGHCDDMPEGGYPWIF